MLFSFRFLNFSFICSHNLLAVHVFSTIVCLLRFTSIHSLICWVSWFVFLRLHHQTNNCSFPSSFIAKNKTCQGAMKIKTTLSLRFQSLCFFFEKWLEILMGRKLFLKLDSSCNPLDFKLSSTFFVIACLPLSLCISNGFLIFRFNKNLA